MNTRRPRRGAPTLRQRGFALIAVLALAAMLTAFLIAIGMNRSGTDLANERAGRDMKVLMQAKTALIAYAANEEWQAYKGQTTNQPGGLPCPDTGPDTTVANTGVSSGICSSGALRVGRLPFATIGSDDLRDASGERLWYAVSSNFYKTGIGGNIINSDTQGRLTVQGSAPANNVVAVVFAPGPPVLDPLIGGQIQDRSSANYNRIASYLEGFTPGTDYTFTSSASPSATLNDRLLVITQAELMAAVEPVVAARIERDIAPKIQDYFNNYGAYPFPAPFDPTKALQSDYQGDTSRTRGMLPVTRSVLQWQTLSVSITHIAGGTGEDLVFSMDCGASTSSQISCRIDYDVDDNNRPAIQIQATLRNAAISLPDVIEPTDSTSATRIRMFKKDGTDADTTPFGQWNASFPQFVPTRSYVAHSSGDATVTYRGRLQNGGFCCGTNGRITIVIPVPDYLKITDGTDPDYGWFVANEWHRLTYYAVSQGFLPDAGNNCTTATPPPPLCLTVNNLRPSYVNSNDKRAILMLAGRSLNGSHPPATTIASDYFESANVSAVNGTTLVYENRSGSPTSINDRVVVISP